MSWILPDGNIIYNPAAVTINGEVHPATIFAERDYWEPLGIFLFEEVNKCQPGRKAVWDDVLDEETGVITRTWRNDEWSEGFLDMKATVLKSAKEKAHFLLQPFDWYFIRKLRTGQEPPQAVLDYCQAVTDACENIEVELNKALSSEDIIKVAPMHEDWWPAKPAL